MRRVVLVLALAGGCASPPSAPVASVASVIPEPATQPALSPLQQKLRLMTKDELIELRQWLRWKMELMRMDRMGVTFCEGHTR